MSCPGYRPVGVLAGGPIGPWGRRPVGPSVGGPWARGGSRGPYVRPVGPGCPEEASQRSFREKVADAMWYHPFQQQQVLF